MSYGLTVARLTCMRLKTTPPKFLQHCKLFLSGWLQPYSKVVEWLDETFQWKKNSSLFCQSISDEEKKICNVDGRATDYTESDVDDGSGDVSSGSGEGDYQFTGILRL